MEAFRKLTALEADVVGVNCLSGPQATVHFLERIPLEFLLSCLSQCGISEIPRRPFHLLPRAGLFREDGSRDGGAGSANSIGGCCGTTPRTSANGGGVGRAQAGAEQTGRGDGRIEASAGPDTPRADRRKPPRPNRGRPPGHHLRTDPPKTLALEKYFAGAQALVQAGCDAITSQTTRSPSSE